MIIANLCALPAILSALNLAALTSAPSLDNPAAEHAQNPQDEFKPVRSGSAEPLIDETSSATTPALLRNNSSTDGDEAKKTEIKTVFHSDSDDEIVRRVVSYLEGLTTMRGEFVQNAPSGAISTGTFWLRRPGQIRFEYDEPTPLMIVATQGNVYVEDRSIDQTDLYPIKQTPLRFLLSKKIELDDVTVRSVERGADSVAVTFSAKDDAETDGDLSIVLAAPDLTLKQWVIRDAQNGVTVVTLKNAETGMKLANSLFRAPQAGGAFINN